MPQTVSSPAEKDNEVFVHKALKISQCDERELFCMTLGSGLIEFKLCDLIAFRKKIFELDLYPLFDTLSSDIEIIYLPHLDRHLLLSLEELLDIRELLSGTFAMLQINSQLHRTLYNPFAG